MIEVLRTGSLSEAWAAWLALEGEGIEAAVQGEQLTLATIPFTVVILDDSRLEEARRVLAEAAEPEGDEGGDGGY